MNRQNTARNPIEKNRRLTDVICIFVFSIIFIVWLSIGISELDAHEKLITDAHKKNFTLYLEITGQSMKGSYLWFLMTLAISLAGTILYIFLTQLIAKILIFMGLLLLPLYTLVIISMTIFHLYYQSFYGPPWAFLILLVSFEFLLFSSIFSVVSLISFFRADKNKLRDIIKDTCRVILRCPLVVLFTILITALLVIVLVLTLNAFVFTLLTEDDWYLHFFDYAIVFFCGMCTMFFIMHFAVMVLSVYTINYYWETENTNFFNLIGQSIIIIVRYHIGTAMFASTWLVAYIVAIVEGVKRWRPHNSEHRTMYGMGKLILVLIQPYYTFMIVSSIYANGFIQSIKKTYDMVLRRPSFFISTKSAFFVVFVLIPLFLWITITGIGIVLTLPPVKNITIHDIPKDKLSKDLRDRLNQIPNHALVRTPEVKQIMEQLDKLKGIERIFYIVPISLGAFIPFLFMTILTSMITAALSINQIIISSRDEPQQGENSSRQSSD